MMLSKISRSLVVVIFIAFIIFLSYFNISNLFSREDVTGSVTSTLIKVGYIFAVVLLVFIYVYIKDKLYKNHVKRKFAFIYRYIYIVLVLITANIFSSRKLFSNYSDSKIIINLIISLVVCFIIKKIIFNVSKSDILSVFAMFAYALLPTINLNSNVHLLSSLLNVTFLRNNTCISAIN